MTGKDEPGNNERVLASGAAVYLQKPLDKKPLLAAIRLAVPQEAPIEEPVFPRFAMTGNDVKQAKQQDEGIT
jgi:DNA-binding response OmpR family regulator